MFSFSLGDERSEEEFFFSSLPEQLSFMVSEIVQQVSLLNTFY